MRRKILVVGGMGMLLSLNACAQRVDTAVEAAAIMALEREWSAKFQEKDIEWINEPPRHQRASVPTER